MRVFVSQFSKTTIGLIAGLGFSIAVATFFLPAAAARIVGGKGVAQFANNGPQELAASENSTPKKVLH